MVYAQPGQAPKATNLPFLKAGWTLSVSPLYRHLATIFVPSIVLEGITAYMEILTKFTQQAFNESQQSLSLVNTELSLMTKAVLQNSVALDIITPWQGGTCAIT